MREHLSEEACPLCIEAYAAGHIRRSSIQRLPKGALAPLSNDGRRMCWDCQTTETVHRLGSVHPDWGACRTVVESDRQQMYRVPGMRTGIAQLGFMKVNADGDWEDQLRWLAENTQGERFSDAIEKAMRVVEDGGNSTHLKE